MAADTHRERHVLWVYVGFILVVLGIGLSLYSTSHHLDVRAHGATDALCNINAKFNCDEVALSPYAEPVAGIPLGVFGLGFFLAQGALLGLGLRNSKSSREHLQAYVIMVGIGVATSVALAGISLGILGTYCLVCLATYGVTFAQAAALFAARRDVPKPFHFSGIANAGGTAALVVAIVIAGFQFLKPSFTTRQASVPSPTMPKQALTEKSVEIPIAKSAYAGLGEDYRKGGDNASVVIQEFADFQCPGCARMAEVLTNLQKEYGDKILVVYRTYPLDSGCNSGVQRRMHDYACKAAVMARCAGQFGKFWVYHDTLYTNQSEINETKLKQWARDMGMPVDQVESCWNSKDLEAKIKDDIDLAGRIGVDSTPTLFINGRKVLGARDMDSLRAQIDALLQP